MRGRAHFFKEAREMSFSLPSISNPSKKPKEATDGRLGRRSVAFPSIQELVTRESLKKVSQWFGSWRDWQRRVFVCQALEHSSKHQLAVLATILEPVLHVDFSSSLVPHLASLHADGAVATFQVQRGVQRRLLVETETSQQEITSAAYLKSLPTTLASSDENESGGREWKSMREGVVKERLILYPALPLTHSKHAPLSPNSSQSDELALRHTRFSSVPDFQSTTNLLRDVKRKDLLRPRHHHKRSRSLTSYLLTQSKRGSHHKQQDAEKFKSQLGSMSEWMSTWPGQQKSQLLLEIIRLCNKEMLAYFVQCLYQRLHEEINLDSLPDSLLLKIFSFLDPVMLCRCSQVSRRWNRIANSPQLWEEQCRVLGRREDVGDLVTAVKSVSKRQECGVIDWKLAYKELSNVIVRIRQLILDTVAEQEEREKEMAERNVALHLTKAGLRARLSLREMIDLAKGHSHTQLSTIQEVLDAAPESPAAIRRRNRKVRKAMEEQRVREASARELSNRYQHRRPYDRSNPSSRLEGLIVDEKDSQRAVHHPHRSTSPDIIELIREAQDLRSGLLYLPNPDGVRCLVLAGCLLVDQPHKPGKTQPIPRLRRLPPSHSTVLCLQCDQKKMVCGTQNREIQIFDIRTGRLVSTFTGHKGSVQCLQFDDNKIVSGSWDTTCIVWDVVHGSIICELVGHTGPISSLKFNEEILITGSLDKSLRIWSTATWESLAIISQAHNGPVRCIAFDGSIIASGGHDRCVKLWSPTTYELIVNIPHLAPLTSVLISKLLLVSACTSGSIKLWDLTPYTPSSTTRRVLPFSPTPLPPCVEQSLVTEWQLEDNVYLTDMVLEGDKIFACGSGCVIYEWDIATGIFTRSLTGHSRPLTCLSVTENKIVSASEDHTVCVWYYKRTKYKAGTAELLMEESDPMFPDIPIRVITA